MDLNRSRAEISDTSTIFMKAAGKKLFRMGQGYSSFVMSSYMLWIHYPDPSPCPMSTSCTKGETSDNQLMICDRLSYTAIPSVFC